ncbi:MAG TPA: glycosyltransferase family 1 protein [Polyangiaceae bacterium]|nr:glycosyltransferase family 1 protein [Polyangiaceae bacterium]
MKILHVTRDFPPRVNGGLSTAVGGLVRALREAQVDQAVVSFDGYRPSSRPGDAEVAIEDQQGVAVLRVSRPGQLPVARAFADEQRPDVVHVHQAMLWDFASAVAAGAPRVFSVHLLQRLLRELRGLDEPTRSERDQERAFIEAEAVTIPSEACRAHLPSIVRDRAAHAPLGVHDHEASQAAVVAPRPPATFLYAARFGDVKGTQQLLEAIPRVAAELPEAKFVLAGGLPDNPKADRRWRRRFVERAPNAELVGWCDAVRLTELYARSTALLVPSWFETFGLSAVEAMLHGTPILASAAGALSELVEPGHNGWLVRPRDVDALVAAIVSAARDDAATLGRRAAVRARDHLWPGRVAAFVGLYERVVGLAR